MKKRKADEIEYTLYEGEEVITHGTTKEIADKLGIKESSVLYYRTPSYQKSLKRNKGKGRVLVKVS